MAGVAAAAALCAGPAGALAADTYSAGINGGQIVATANADLTEATIESVSVSFEECGTHADEATCTWEARTVLHSHPESRCDPSTPEEQVAWTTGPLTENGAFAFGPVSFALEGCAGQSLVLELESRYTYDEGSSAPWRVLGETLVVPLFTFGFHPDEEAEERIVRENPPAFVPPPSLPDLFAIAGDCRSLLAGNARYAFAFHGIGCRRASNLALMRHASHASPSGYHCRNGDSGGVLCWRRGNPRKYVEWRLPGARPLHESLSPDRGKS